MKQRFSIILTVIFLSEALVFTACQRNHAPQYRVGLSQCSDDAWRQKMDEEMERELMFHPELSLTIRSADDNSVLQSLQIDSFIQEKVDLLIVSPNEADGLTDAVSRAYDAGIPVIVADRRVHGNKYTAFIGGDNLQVGHLLGKYLKEKFPAGADILLLRGLEGSTPDVLRYEGLQEEIQNSQIHISQEIRADWFYDNAKQIVESLPNKAQIQIIVAFNDRMAIGAWDALQDSSVVVIGVDALPGKNGGIEAIAQGKLTASVSYATVGDLIIQTAAKILNGEPYRNDTVIPAMLIDPVAAEPLMELSDAIDKEMLTISTLRNYIDIYEVQARQQRLLLLLSVLLALTAFGFFIYFLYQYRKTKRLSERLLQAQEEIERQTLSKLTFFTNVSHDFRTPLTLISDPVSQLAKDKSLTTEQHQLARLAEKNAQVLLRLINQTLDFRKYESGMLRLNKSRVDMVEAMSQWVDAFQPLAHRKHIHLCFNHKEEQILAALDIEKTERIVYNLVANAFKFTPQNGKVDVTLWAESGKVLFEVSDNGMGIPDEHKSRIYESFYQVDTTNRQGSGIGLTLVKSFVTLQGGDIRLLDNPAEHGTVFSVSLPIGEPDKMQFEVGEKGYVNISSEQILTEQDEVKIEQNEAENQRKDKVMLVIDDNADIRHYLTHLFYKDYTVVTAKDGREGIQRAMQTVPNIIICDVSMPDMDGFEACKRLKTEIATSHIPVLMLTAHSMDEQQIAGLQHGADAYMTKPFNKDVLQAQVMSLVENRVRVKRVLPIAPLVQTENKNIAISAEQSFVERFTQIVMKHLDDDQLSVEQIASELAMSRTQLYRKIKQLTNYSPNELVRNTRLEHARTLLLKGGKSVSEVAYETGFTSPSYFTKCYSDYFGTLPSEIEI